MYSLEEIKKRAVPIAKRHGVKSLSLFGSYAKGLQNEKSDIDFFMDSGNITSYFKYIAFVDALENEFNCHIDLISEGIEDKDFLRRIEKDKKLIYVREG